jgi:hypothetical protein
MHGSLGHLIAALAGSCQQGRHLHHTLEAPPYGVSVNDEIPRSGKGSCVSLLCVRNIDMWTTLHVQRSPKVTSLVARNICMIRGLHDAHRTQILCSHNICVTPRIRRKCCAHMPHATRDVTLGPLCALDLRRIEANCSGSEFLPMNLSRRNAGPFNPVWIGPVHVRKVVIRLSGTRIKLIKCSIRSKVT